MKVLINKENKKLRVIVPEKLIEIRKRYAKVVDIYEVFRFDEWELQDYEEED